MLTTAPLAPAAAYDLEHWLEKNLLKLDRQAVINEAWSFDQHYKISLPASELSTLQVESIPQLRCLDLSCQLKTFKLDANAAENATRILAAMDHALEFGYMILGWKIIDQDKRLHSVTTRVDRHEGNKKTYKGVLSPMWSPGYLDEAAGENPLGEKIWSDLIGNHGWQHYANELLPDSRDHLFIDCDDHQSLCRSILPILDQLSGSRIKSLELSSGLNWPHFFQFLKSINEKPEGDDFGDPRFAKACQRQLDHVANSFSLTKKVQIETHLANRFDVVNAIVSGQIDLSTSVIQGIKIEAPFAAFTGASTRRRLNRRLEKSGHLTYYIKGNTPPALVALLEEAPSRFN